MTAGITEDLEEQLACTIRDGRLSIETRLALDEDTDANDLFDILQTSVQLCRQDRKRIQDRKPGGTGGILDRYLIRDPPADGERTIHEGQLPAHEDQVTRPDRGHVSGNRSRSSGKGEPEGTQAFFRSHETWQHIATTSARTHPAASISACHQWLVTTWTSIWPAPSRQFDRSKIGDRSLQGGF